MSTPTTTANKTENKGNVKSNTAKSGISQEKTIEKLRQEIEGLTKTVKAIQKKQDTQTVMVSIPDEIFNEINGYISKISQEDGYTYNFSELICEAISLYLDAARENKCLEEERRIAELDVEKKN